MAVDDRFYSMRGRGAGRVIIPPDAGALVSIAFSSTSTESSFMEGEKFPLAKFKVSALYSGGVTYDVTYACTYKVNSPVQLGDTTLTVIYESLTLTWNYTVTGGPVPAPSSTLFLCHCNAQLPQKDEVTGNTTSFFRGTIETLNIVQDIHGKFDECLRIESGSARNANIPTIEEIQKSGGTKSATFSAYIKKNAAPYEFGVSCNHYVAFGTNGYCGVRINTRVDNGDIYLTGFNLRKDMTSYQDDAQVNKNCTFGSEILIDSDWHKFAFYITSTTITMYMDGSSLGSIDMSDVNYYSKNDNTGFYVGYGTYVDEICICNGLGGTQPTTGPYYIS